MPQFRMKRKNLPEGDCLCNYCTALCCRYFSLPIKTPKTWADFDTIHWYLKNGKISLFVEDGTWYLVVFGACKYLTADNRCGIYHTRPVICGTYTTDGCEYDNDFVFDQYFETPEQILEYAEAILPPRTSRRDERPGTIVIKVDKPENWDDFDNFRWYMTHGRIAMFIERGKWYLVVYEGDEVLTEDALRSLPSLKHRLTAPTSASANGGTATATRRRVSRRTASPPVQFARFFASPEELWDYAGALLPPREPLERDRPQGMELPIVNI